MKVRQFLLSCVVLAMTAVTGMAEDRPQGLMWNRSGLAATLPLQVKTDADHDYLLRLYDAETGAPVLAAYVRGGAFFRVLVPPGRYRLGFATGRNWQDETALFGPDTRHFVLDPPLEFGATITRKHGHLIDLRGGTGPEMRGFALCQRFALDPGSLIAENNRLNRAPARLQDGRIPSGDFPIPRYQLRSRPCD